MFKKGFVTALNLFKNYSLFLLMVTVVTYREVSAEYFDNPHPRQLKKTLSPGAINIIL